ncbi:MAG: nucleotidyltransferase domain-containing protein [Candidatus Omnitrophica bacterium]|nr:nucleotidyltransferase domain-containing protein [Candidatus Omnitrophota bacterium]
MKKDTFSSTTTQKILDFLCENPYESFYSAQVALKTNLSKGGTNQALRRMSKEDLVVTEKKGRMVFYRADSKSPIVKQFRVLRNVASLEGIVDKVKPYAERIVLFGSCAQGEDTQKSDVDIFVVSGDRKKVERLISAGRFKREVQHIIKSPQEYIGFEKREPELYAEVKKGIVLWEKE